MVTEPGLSHQIILVFSRIKPDMPAPIMGSYSSTSTPKPRIKPSAIALLGPYAEKGTNAWLPDWQYDR